MKRKELKKLVTESVLNFLNDVEFNIPGKIVSVEKPLFNRGSGKTINTFKLNKKEN